MGALVLSVRRSKEYIGLNLSAVVWKSLVGQEVHREDLDGIDVLLTRSMQDIRTIDQKGERCNAVCDLPNRADGFTLPSVARDSIFTSH